MTTLAMFPTAIAVDTSDAQCTPRDLALELGHFDVDVCSNPRSHIQSTLSYMLEKGEDGLAELWQGADGEPWSVWCNGPYSYPDPWCERLRAHRGPWASLWKLETTTEWFRQLMRSGAKWAPFKSRIRFEKAGNVGSADFCSMMVWKDWRPSKAVRARLWMARREI